MKYNVHSMAEGSLCSVFVNKIHSSVSFRVNKLIKNLIKFMYIWNHVFLYDSMANALSMPPLMVFLKNILILYKVEKYLKFFKLPQLSSGSILKKISSCLSVWLCLLEPLLLHGARLLPAAAGLDSLLPKSIH